MLQSTDGATLDVGNGTVLDEGNFADKAKEIIAGCDGGYRFKSLTPTKLRGIYGLIINVYSKVNTAEDFNRHKGDLQYLKVKTAYESGREKAVRTFIEKSGLMRALDGVKTYEQFRLYCRFAESLVAYSKFYGEEGQRQ